MDIILASPGTGQSREVSQAHRSWMDVLMNCGDSQQRRCPHELLPSPGLGAWGDALVPRW